jgi:hypothetical protein
LTLSEAIALQNGDKLANPPVFNTIDRQKPGL